MSLLPSTAPAQDPTGTPPLLAEPEPPVLSDHTARAPCLGFTTAPLPCSGATAPHTPANLTHMSKPGAHLAQQHNPHQLCPSTGQSSENPGKDPGAGLAGGEQPECVWASALLASLSVPREAEPRSHVPARAGSIRRRSCGSPRAARGEGRALQMGTRGCVSASRAPVPGSPRWRLCGSSALCPSPSRTACRIQGLCKCPSPRLPPPAPPLPGEPGTGNRGGCTRPGLPAPRPGRPRSSAGGSAAGSPRKGGGGSEDAHSFCLSHVSSPWERWQRC